jgi:2-methylcitrate dehydratase
VTIRTKDGRLLQKRVEFPRGNPENRMSDAELRDKFIECAGARLQTAQIDRIIETCMNIDELPDFGELVGQLAVTA